MPELDAPVVAATTKKRGGRDLRVAVPVGLGLLAIVGVSLFISKAYFIIVAALAVGLAMWELDQALSRKGIRIPVVPLAVGGAGVCISSYQIGLEGLLIACVLTIVAAVVWRLMEGGGQGAVRDLTGIAFAVAYLPLMAGFVVIILAEPGGQYRVALLLLLAVASDVGGFFAGVFLGKHPLAPSVSPKKTWEGLAGSFALAIAVALVGAKLIGIDPISAAMLGIIVPVTATLGDLGESLLKRDLGLKDMGSLLPGHGGVLDRIDSMLLTAPFVYVVFAVADRMSAVAGG
ncbi:phosphatidate cytidylyltransferase [Rarobacter incanus]|uniref:Phosphatidate cytidylyltransferase n=1 Tax=Rarobacter incanus TaxID=153494 RepID=A0A542SLD6_9MICO|nr:phosphatidate cytidylyltransferase [Rarobacter incanus]TQK75432.1 phosphatidate cytidylyltransferase [Rarobacter incanus]